VQVFIRHLGFPHGGSKQEYFKVKNGG